MPIKPNDDVLRNIQDRVSYLRRALASMRKVTEAGTIEEFWGAVSAVIEGHKRSAEARLVSFLKVNDNERVALLQQLNDANLFLNIPNDFKRDIPSTEKQLKEAVAAEAAYRAKLAKT